MLEGRLAEIYKELWSEDELPEKPSWYLADDDARPVKVFYDTFSFKDGEAGKFMTHRERDGRITDGPQIWIYRQQPPDPQDEPDLAGAGPEELITLAHERGHEQSWRDRTYRATTMAEERRAWGHARRILGSLDFTEWTEFEDHMRISLAKHVSHGTPEE